MYPTAMTNKPEREGKRKKALPDISGLWETDTLAHPYPHHLPSPPPRGANLSGETCLLLEMR